MRKSWAITTFMLFFNGGAVLLEVTGVTAAWGVESPTGTTAALGDAQAAMNGIQASGGLADTLFGSFAAAANAVEAIGRAVIAGPLLMAAAGIPEPFLVFLFAPAGLIVGRDILHALTGRFA
ncbi:hypothetical protein DQW50_16190 [Halorubrum sp. 48-1-W]|uniref:hypothetical protein n=1 Tax=Halorubrum sp. 48-1-W TaxID=2249761 RepID=UPI000DCC5BB9|nr:hypothetical protein [Halorubrum sp. 48-1-W]RAW44064.1 hypothetical protein DQW50_16190 [Halorubrum sp. 48-1-W]